ncbi:hypothetical protein UFOVP65_11 [uncultured Caudovirales phage]|jgi:hypothetical protein|uniref:Bbp19-like phage domain-containing protein n=1 Tax=uncultured Caudovirales phage TaxID=2100421 RepID=A0A6J5KTE5_9CAUD|nr:endopeptidase [Polynucleobacter sp. UB-Piko-W3]MBU3554833.1 endopeptidase [Polynucleobacter sp. UB-Piko-W3]CAB4124532.1 hypothetical protein UFOVP65_11 [uncultured Caudovirales phage]
MSYSDPLDLRGQEKAKAETDEVRKLTLQTEQEDFKWLMGSKRGRRIVWRLLERTGVYRSSFTGNSETFFREGQRNVGLMLMAQINEHAPDQYALMLKEQTDVKRNNDDGRRNDH